MRARRRVPLWPRGEAGGRRDRVALELGRGGDGGAGVMGSRLGSPARLHCRLFSLDPEGARGHRL